MTVHEQSIKHETRTKLVLEALSILCKTMKDKQINSEIQKALIISTLSVIDSLVSCDSSIFQNQSLIAQDNFINSIRAAVVRDA